MLVILWALFDIKTISLDIGIPIKIKFHKIASVHFETRRVDSTPTSEVITVDPYTSPWSPKVQSWSWLTDSQPFCSMLISSPIPEIQLFQNLTLKMQYSKLNIWPWKFKVMVVVKIPSVHPELDELMAWWHLKSPWWLPGRSLHLTLVTKRSVSWSRLIDSHPFCAQRYGQGQTQWSHLRPRVQLTCFFLCFFFMAITPFLADI